MVRVDKEYIFDGPRCKVSLAGLFGGRRQLIVFHVMFGPDWDAACPICTEFTSELTGAFVERLRARDTAFVMACRAPLDRIEAYVAGPGWAVPCYSSYGSDFNYDFQVTLDESVPQLEYNYRPEPDRLGGAQSTELSGASCFLRTDADGSDAGSARTDSGDGGEIYHTYSAYARGLDHVDLPYAFLDLTALGGRNPGSSARAARRR